MLLGRPATEGCLSPARACPPPEGVTGPSVSQSRNLRPGGGSPSQEPPQARPGLLAGAPAKPAPPHPAKERGSICELHQEPPGPGARRTPCCVSLTDVGGGRGRHSEVPAGLRKTGRLNPRKRRAGRAGRERPPGSRAGPPRTCRGRPGQRQPMSPHANRGLTGRGFQPRLGAGASQGELLGDDGTAHL